MKSAMSPHSFCVYRQEPDIVLVGPRAQECSVIGGEDDAILEVWRWTVCFQDLRANQDATKSSISGTTFLMANIWTPSKQAIPVATID